MLLFKNQIWISQFEKSNSKDRLSMHIIGIAGGGTVWGLGTVQEIQLFFDCIETHVVKSFPNENWKLITDRLYKRYLRPQELDVAVEKMNMIQKVFATLPNNTVDWTDYAALDKEYHLNQYAKTLDNIFKKYFEAFYDCVEAAKLSYESYTQNPDFEYERVFFLISEIPWSFVEKDRLDEDYDNLQGDPFWKSS